MTLAAALKDKGYDDDEITEMIEEMSERVLYDGEEPENVLLEVGLDADYVFDLLTL